MRAAVPNLRPKLQLYTGEIPIFAAHNVQREIERIYEPRASLKSGGHIVIELYASGYLWRPACAAY
jgi:Ribonuclease G/E